LKITNDDVSTELRSTRF